MKDPQTKMRAFEKTLKRAFAKHKVTLKERLTGPVGGMETAIDVYIDGSKYGWGDLSSILKEAGLLEKWSRSI